MKTYLIRLVMLLVTWTALTFFAALLSQCVYPWDLLPGAVAMLSFAIVYAAGAEK